MTDIRERLRAQTEGGNLLLLREAAAEIERLRAESEAFRGKLAEQCGQTLVARDQIEQLMAENERLIEVQMRLSAEAREQIQAKDAEIERLMADGR